MHNPFSLQDKTVLVTGASSGIGRSVAIECSRMGAKVVITGRNTNRLAETMNMLEGTGHCQIPADLSSFPEIENLAEKCPALDGISHNAGIANIIRVKFITPSKLEELVGTNTFGPILLTQQLVKRKKVRKKGSIVFTSSLKRGGQRLCQGCGVGTGFAGNPRELCESQYYQDKYLQERGWCALRGTNARESAVLSLETIGRDDRCGLGTCFSAVRRFLMGHRGRPAH